MKLSKRLGGECPACRGGIPARRTILKEVDLLCVKHQKELDAYLSEVAEKRMPGPDIRNKSNDAGVGG